MLVNNVSLLFYLKKPKGGRVSEYPLYLRITVDGAVKEISISRKCTVQNWSKDGEKAIGKSEECKELNHYISTLRLKIFEFKRVVLDSGKIITVEAIVDFLKGREENAKKILEVFAHHNQQMAALVGTEYSEATIKRYRTTLDHTRAFLKWKYGVEDLDIRQLNFEFLSEFEFYFKSIRKCNHNSTMKYLSNFRKIVNRCVHCGWLIRDPFIGFKMKTREVERIALTEGELIAMADKEFIIERLQNVRDIFLFCCYTGLSYIDAKKLKWSEIIVGIDGEQWICTNRQKTDTNSRIPMLPIALQIAEKYKENIQCKNKGTVLPVLSNQKMNSYLKEIADVCGITKRFTFHIARHTFATTVTLLNGVPIETVSKMLGHRDLRTTQHYAKILDLKTSSDMAVLRARLKNPLNVD